MRHLCHYLQSSKSHHLLEKFPLLTLQHLKVSFTHAVIQCNCKLTFFSSRSVRRNALWIFLLIAFVNCNYYMCHCSEHLLFLLRCALYFKQWASCFKPMNEMFQNGRLEVAKILVKAGAIVDPQDKYGDTPLVMSCTDEVRDYLESVQDN